MSKSFLYTIILSLIGICSSIKCFGFTQIDSLAYADITLNQELAHTAFLQKNYKKAVTHSKISQRALLKIQTKDSTYWQAKEKNLALLYQLYKKQVNYKESYQTQKLLISVRDTIALCRIQSNIQRINYEHELAKLSTEQEMIKAESASHIASLRGRTYSIIALVSLIILASGAIYAFLQKNRKRALIQLKLKHKVAIRTQKLEAAREELQETHDELEQLAYIASHDLKKPLQSIRSHVDKIEVEKNTITTEVHPFLNFITDSSKRLEQLIDDLFSFSTSEVKNPSIEKCDLNHIVTEAKEHLHRLFIEQNAQVNHEPLPLIHTNAPQLSVILKNLIENGIKYNKNSYPTVNISYQRQKQKHYIYVQDNGIGIAPENQKDVFKMFKRLHTREQYDGTGLGLAICQKIAHTLGGQIILESTLGKGSTFIIELPVNN